ncbi:hypothetical protein QEH59_08815 [Coraliomargarita sp. SDUM461004]|uniref:Uncharacterized protein n=1 Tax=Thalassobacterium sedimentorum TaxID=3041258 RepID=A0ABU1AIK3_9BACT|nr:hypothetical protein [Coraliomargarita sp. SDUM461004]MDQ8194527.1 hypothetical protein [Coraliomargarita sp. SDUM461004]
MLTFIGSVPVVTAEPLRVMEETAIPYMSFLSKADFDQRYPGEMLDNADQLDVGWYVIYEHQALNYYFGPILLESIGEDYLAQLTETVEAAVEQRPSIKDYRLELSYEPSLESVERGADEPLIEAPAPMPPQDTSTPSFWSKVKRFFGL